MSSKAKSLHAELDQVLNYVDSSKGLRAKLIESGQVQIYQDVDGKFLTFNAQELAEILHRTDSEGKGFVQVNFKSGTKVLLTDTLVGFKPEEIIGLDMTRIPKVVTTPDLLSVFEAIEESLGSDSSIEQEVEILKKVYLAIISGAESVGFDLAFERLWISRLIASKFRASA